MAGRCSTQFNDNNVSSTTPAPSDFNGLEWIRSKIKCRTAPDAKSFKEGLKMRENKFKVEKGDMMIKDGVMLMKEGLSLQEVDDMMIIEGQKMMNK